MVLREEDAKRIIDGKIAGKWPYECKIRLSPENSDSPRMRRERRDEHAEEN
jgi:hypothetical protein